MKKFYNRIVNHPKTILLIFSILFIICFIAKQFIAVNYDMNDYLPSDSEYSGAFSITSPAIGNLYSE